MAADDCCSRKILLFATFSLWTSAQSRRELSVSSQLTLECVIVTTWVLCSFPLASTSFFFKNYFLVTGGERISLQQIQCFFGGVFELHKFYIIFLYVLTSHTLR